MSNPQTTTCDAGCNQQFTVEFITDRIGNGVDKIYFVCPHCQHEYLAFYSDADVRRLQAKMRKIHQKWARQEVEIRQQIKERTDTLRLEVEAKG